MISFIFASKPNESLDETIHALSQFKNINIDRLSDEVAAIKMPISFFEICSHSLEYWGIITVV